MNKNAVCCHKGMSAALILLNMLLSACAQTTPNPATAPTGQAVPTQISTSANTSTVQAEPTQIATSANPANVRSCLYVPGQSVPLPITPEMFQTAAPTPLPTAIQFQAIVVDPETTTRQIELYTEIWNTVKDRYVYRDFHGVDWVSIGKRYETLIRQGLTMEDFYRAMNEMVLQLGDNHSQYLSPDQVKNLELARAGRANFVGIGVQYQPSEVNDQPVLMVIDVFPGGPAEKAGLKPHDTVTQIDGGPVLDESGNPRTAGPEDTSVTITVYSPGQPARTLELVRKPIQTDVPVDFCLVPNTHIGYIGVRSYINANYPAQIRAAIQKMSEKAPLEGLILDNRGNRGGEGSTEKAILALFATGEQGKAVGAGGQDLWNITNPLDIDGSQQVPMVVLVDEFSASGGEIVPGMLQNSRRAKVVGMQTSGTTDGLDPISFEDGSLLYLATMSFQPFGGEVGQWEKKGITPDVVVPARWNQYSEANDPMLAKAVELLQTK